MTAPARRYERQGLLAVNPLAFLSSSPVDPVAPTVRVQGDLAIVPVRGFLEQSAGSAFMSYESILDLVDVACTASASTVVLRVNSPGGDVYGMTDASRAIRAKCTAAGKRLIAFVDGEATSAAYALACAASEIIVSDTSFVGSIGVIESRLDLTRHDAAAGVLYALTTSGQRKADLHPHSALTEAELASAQQRVDSLAEVFFSLVAASRPGLTVETVRALQAATFHGVAAVTVGLADRVASFDALLANVASGGETMADEQTSHLDAARAALEKVAAGEGADAEKAKAALAAMDAEPATEEEPADEGAKAESGDSEGDPEDKPRDKPAAASAAMNLAATVQKQSAQIAALMADKERSDRQALFAGRPDLAPSLVAALATTPLAEARRIIAAVPAPSPRNLAASSQAQGTRGVGQTNDPAPAPADPADPLTEKMNQAFGTGPAASAIKREGNRKDFGVMAPDEARAAHASIAAKAAGTSGKEATK